jgi:crotonobetainyl-CoA:carnitine CoA-transferase CaiB-like acyl-CoA transferase
MITVTTAQWDGLLKAVGRDELVGDANLNTPQKRGRNAAGIMKEIAAYLATRPTDEVVALLSANGVPCGKVASLEEMPAIVEALSPGFLVHERHPQLGDMIHPSPAVRFDETSPILPAPALGEHTAEVLSELS